MKQQHLLLYLCSLVPVAVSILRGIPHKYELIMTPLSWTNAQNYCREKYVDLATVISDNDFMRLKNESARKGLATAAWVGLYDDIYSWRWTLDDLLLKDQTYSNWASGQPNNAIGIERCVMMASSGAWLDTYCEFVRAYICYDAKFTGASKFIGYNILVNWPTAQAYCRTHHTDLASSLNSSDNNLLAQWSGSMGQSWIGLTRESWKWSDRTNISYTAWATGKPNNAARIMPNCGSVINGLFTDEPCANLHYFFCHTIAPVGHIMKMQFKSDKSVLDPAVQSSILEQMKQKLDQNGILENTTVYWRVQPDGNIFHKKKKAQILTCDPLRCECV